MKHKKLVSMVLTTALVASVAGVTANASSESVTLTLAANRDAVGVWEQIVERFNEQYPNISVEIAPFDDYTNLDRNILSAHQAGDDYDLLTVNHTNTRSFQQGGILYDMTDSLAEQNIDVDSILMGTLEDFGKVGDRVYAISIDTDTRVMLVNKDLFDKYELAVPTTMEEMLEAGKVIKEADQGDYIFTDEMCTNGDFFATVEAGIFLASCGGQSYVVDDDGIATATIDTPEMREYLNFIQELLQYMPEDCTTNNDARSAFCQGNIGMYTFGPWEYLEMDLDNLGFNTELVKVPAGSAGSVSTSGGFQIGIGAGSDNIDEAVQFVSYLITDPVSMELIGSTGLPTIESAYEEGQFASEKYDVFKEQLQSSKLAQVPLENVNETMACFTGYWNEMCAGLISVDEMIAEAQPAVQELLDEHNETVTQE